MIFGCRIERENDIFDSVELGGGRRSSGVDGVGFEDGEMSSGGDDGGSGGGWEALVSVSRTGEEISLRLLLL